MTKYPNTMLVLAAALIACACSRDEPEHSAQPVALVEVEVAQTHTARQTLSAYGTTEFAAASATTLSVQVESQVAELLVTAGDEVKRGQALVRLLPSPTTRLDVGKARRDAGLAGAELSRLERLRNEGLATESDLQAAASAAATATATRDSLAARVGPGDNQMLRAPRDGIVDALTIQPGDVLAPGSVALKMSAPDALQVRLGIDPVDASRVAAGQAVTLTSLTRDATTVSALVSGVDRRVDPQTRFVAALVKLPAHSGLLPGAALRAEIVVAQRENAVRVPRAALVYAGDQAYVFVAAGNKAQRHDVKTGAQEGDAVEITEGLKSGESVIVSGNSVLEDGAAIRLRASSNSDKPAADGDGKP